MQQSRKLDAVALAYPGGTCTTVLDFQEALLPIGCRPGVGMLDGSLLALRYTPRKTVDEESEEEGDGKDRHEEVHDKPEIRGDASAQAVHSGEQALPQSSRVQTGIQAVQILAGGRDIEDLDSAFLGRCGSEVSRPPQGSGPSTRAGAGSVQQELPERAGYHRAGKGRAARQVSWLQGTSDVL